MGDVKVFGLAEEKPDAIYVPYAQNPMPVVALSARTTAAPLSMLNVVKSSVQGIDKDLPFIEVNMMDHILKVAASESQYQMFLLVVFALFALVLASMGIYGVISYAVTLRTNEFGIRAALGAQQGDLLRLVIKQGLFLAMLGAAMGWALAVALTRTITSLLFQTRAADQSVFAAVAFLIFFVALAACFVPARRATRVDPMTALRQG